MLAATEHDRDIREQDRTLPQSEPERRVPARHDEVDLPSSVLLLHQAAELALLPFRREPREVQVLGIEPDKRRPARLDR